MLERDRSTNPGIKRFNLDASGYREQAFQRMVETATWASMQLEGCHGNQRLPQYGRAKETLATIRDEVRRFGFPAGRFDRTVARNIADIKRKEEQDREEDK